ncbi:hypothetical protein PM082_007806 [Marasmius tenuissimus]|nr:hypothetical protein PM082_007806 [Marasmius tenuissimus]
MHCVIFITRDLGSGPEITFDREKGRLVPAHRRRKSFAAEVKSGGIGLMYTVYRYVVQWESGKWGGCLHEKRIFTNGARRMHTVYTSLQIDPLHGRPGLRGHHVYFIHVEPR